MTTPKSTNDNTRDNPQEPANPTRGQSRWELSKRLFNAAMAVPVDQRAAFLDAQCVGNPDVRAEVESLLSARTLDIVKTHGAAHLFAAGATTAHAPITEKAGESIGNYKLLQVIGAGGFGTVFMAEQTDPVRRRVALKVIKLGMDTRQIIARFEAERQALAMMDHPNIAKVLDAGATATGRPYFVMELVRGDPITEYCDKHNLSIADRLGLFVQVCHAVQHAHGKGVIHRDLKPTNILVATQDGKPFAKVIDFGIAKATNQQLTEKTLFTEHRALIGTPEYMSPEQAEGSLDIDTRTDIYALGVLLYELLTGSTPFDPKALRAKGFDEIQRIIREVDPPKPSTRLSQAADTIAAVASRRQSEPRKLGTLVRGELDWIVMKCLEKERARRYDTASSVAADVVRYLAGEPVVAAPPSRAYRVRKFVRRNRAAVTSLVLIAGTLLVAVAISLGFAFSEARERARAESAEETSERNATKLQDALSRESAARQSAEEMASTANILAAQASLADGNYPEARERLRDCPPERRLWEWHYLMADASASQSAIRGTIQSLSRDGSTAIIGGELYDIRTGKRIDRFKKARGASFSIFSKSASRFATNEGYGLQVWDYATEKMLFTLAPGRSTNALVACFSFDERMIATAFGADNTIEIWDGTTGDRRWPLALHQFSISSMAFSPTEPLLVSGSYDRAAIVWDAQTGKPVSTLQGHTAPIVTTQFSPDGSWILTEARDSTVRLWGRGPSGSAEWVPKQTLPYESLRGVVASFSPDSRRFVTVSRESSARVWDVATGACTGILHADQGTFNSARFSADGSSVITSSTSGVIAIWNPSSGHVVQEMIGHVRRWYDAQVTSDDKTIVASPAYGELASEMFTVGAGVGRRELSWSLGRSSQWCQFISADRVLTQSPGGVLHLWDCRKGEEFKLGVTGESALNVRASPDGRRFMILSASPGVAWSEAPDLAPRAQIHLLDTESGRLIGTLSDGRHFHSQIEFSDDGSVCAAIVDNKEVNVWNAADGALLAVLRAPDDDRQFDLDRLEFGRGHTCLAARNDYGIGYVWNLTSGKIIARPWSIDSDNEDEMPFVETSRDGRMLVVSSPRDSAEIVNVHTGSATRLDGTLTHLGFVEFSQDGRVLVTTSKEGTRLWDTATGIELLKDAVCAELTYASQVVVTPDSSIAAATMQNGTVAVYDLRTGAKIDVLVDPSGPLEFLGFNAQATRAATTDGKGSIRLFAIESTACPVLQEWPGVGLPQSVSASAFSDDSTQFAVLWGSSGIVLDATGKTRNQSPLAPPRSAAYTSVRFSPDGRQLVARNQDEPVSVWDLPTGSNAHRFIDDMNRRDPIERVRYSSDLNSAIVSTIAGDASIVDVESGESRALLWKAREPLAAAAVSHDLGRIIAVNGSDAAAQVWDAVRGTVVADLRGHRDSVVAVDMTPDGAFVATGSRDGTSKLWKVGQQACVATLHDGASPVQQIALSHDASTLIVASEDHTVRIWDIQSSAQTASFQVQSPVLALTYAADAHAALCHTREEILVFVPGSDAKPVKTSISGRFNSAMWDSTAKTIVTTSAHDLALWDAASGRQLRQIALRESPCSARFDATGSNLLVGTTEGSALVLSVSTGEIVHQVSGHEGPVIAAAFVDGGRRMFTASRDRSVRLWNPLKQKEVLRFAGAGGPIRDLWVSRDEKRILAITDNGDILVRDSNPAGYQPTPPAALGSAR